MFVVCTVLFCLENPVLLKTLGFWKSMCSCCFFWDVFFYHFLILILMCLNPVNIHTLSLFYLIFCIQMRDSILLHMLELWYCLISYTESCKPCLFILQFFFFFAQIFHFLCSLILNDYKNYRYKILESSFQNIFHLNVYLNSTCIFKGRWN